MIAQVIFFLPASPVDGQWRFPELQELPPKYEKALLTFEDQHFYAHPGVNPLAIGRALIQNARAGKTVSGGEYDYNAGNQTFKEGEVKKPLSKDHRNGSGYPLGVEI